MMGLFYYPEHGKRKSASRQRLVCLFDGDSGRLIAVDENGEIADGDKIMHIIGFIFAKGLLEKYDIAR